MLVAALVLVLAGTPAVAGPGTKGTTPATADTGTTPTTPGASPVVVHMSGKATFVLDKTFVRALKQAKVTLTASRGAKLKGRTITLPINADTAVTPDSGTADIPFNGRLQLRRKGGGKLLAELIMLRVRPAGADIGATLRGLPGLQLAALTSGPQTTIEQSDGGYDFNKVQMLVSADLASAAKKAKLGGLTAGADFALMTAKIKV